jgi:hypothetical protein
VFVYNKASDQDEGVTASPNETCPEGGTARVRTAEGQNR